jgi:uncharacterized protein (DUF1800 family)
MSVDAWAPYQPTAALPWNLRRVVHLHRRAGFAATWSELQRDVQDGPGASIDRLLEGKATTLGSERFTATAELLADAAVTAGDITRLKAWWLYRMLLGPDPLGEKLTLLWHNHFATSEAKVRSVGAMRRQNDTFRFHARAPFGELLNAALRDPALLVYLDAPANRKGHANENLGRELLELFTLGIGHYDEADVKDAARALTGWTVDEGAFAEVAARHDGGVKTLFGKQGNWKGADLVRLLLEHPATAQRLAWRLCSAFFGEKAIAADAIKALGDELFRRKLDTGWALATILRSQLFFAEANLRTRVVSPVEFVVGTIGALELLDPPPSTLALADWCGRLGQDLFEPANVGGWPGGRAWLNARTMIGRANFVTALLEGQNAGSPFEPAALAKKHGAKSGEMNRFFTRLLRGTDPGDIERAAFASGNDRQAVAQLFMAPEGQLV